MITEEKADEGKGTDVGGLLEGVEGERSCWKAVEGRVKVPEEGTEVKDYRDCRRTQLLEGGKRSCWKVEER